MRKFILILAIVAAAMTEVRAAGTYVISNTGKEPLDVSGFMAYLEDSTGRLAIDQLLAGGATNRFRPFYQPSLTRESSKGSPLIYWAVLRLANHSGELLQYTPTCEGYEYADFYIVRGNRVAEIFRSGCRRVQFSFLQQQQFQILPGEELTVYARYQRAALAPGTLFQLVLKNTSMTAESQEGFFFSSLLIGVLLFTFVYTLFLLFSFRQQLLLWFALLQSGLIFFLTDLNGIVSARVFFEKAEVFFVFPSVQLGAFLFVAQAVRTDMHLPRLHRWLCWLVLIIIAVPVSVYVYAGQSRVFNLLQDTGFVLWGASMLCILLAAVVRRLPFATAMLLSLAPMLLPVLVPMLYGSLPSESVFEAAIAVQVLTWVALSSFRLRKMREDHIRTQADLISSLSENTRIITRYNEELEEKVARRTAELTAAQDQLIHAEKQKENELIRSRISQDIHDDVSSELSRISWISELAKSHIAKGELAETPALLDKVTTSSRESIARLSEIIWAINPRSDNFDSLLAYMRNYLSGYLEHTGLAYNIDFPHDIEVTIDPELKRNLFLVLKEALHNAVRYAEATRVDISFGYEHGRFLLRIADDGKGFSPDMVAGGGNGLKNMRARMEKSGGTCEISSAPGKGTVIVLRGKV